MLSASKLVCCRVIFACLPAMPAAFQLLPHFNAQCAAFQVPACLLYLYCSGLDGALLPHLKQLQLGLLYGIHSVLSASKLVSCRIVIACLPAMSAAFSLPGTFKHIVCRISSACLPAISVLFRPGWVRCCHT
jgi:hypothetical protein